MKSLRPPAPCASGWISTSRCPRETLLECLELAIQAPTGSNAQGWQWVLVEDPDKKKALADIYRTNFACTANFRRPNTPTATSAASNATGGRSSADTSPNTWRGALVAGAVPGRPHRRGAAAPRRSGDRCFLRSGATCSRCVPAGSARRTRRCISSATARSRPPIFSASP